MAQTVTLTLAHPLTAEQAQRRRAKDVKDYNIGDKITVPVDEGRAIIDAGFAAGVDPEDRDAVKKTLGADTAPSAAVAASASSAKKA